MNDLLAISMSAAIPLWIMSLKEKGGPTNADFNESKEAGELLAHKGDILLYKGGKKGETANIFNKTAKAIAVLSFCPGGITIFNQHYESIIPNKNKLKLIKLKSK